MPLTFHSHSDALLLGTYPFSTNGCELEKVLLPILLKTPRRLLPGDSMSEQVARLSGSQSGIIDLQSPTELFMGEMASVTLNREDAARRQRTKKLLTDEIQTWAEGQGRIVAQEKLEVGPDHAFLGMIAVAANRTQIEEGGAATISVKYISSHEELIRQEESSSYELAITQEPPLRTADFNVEILPQHGRDYQQILPVVDEGLWQFVVRALPGFKGCPISLRYRLRRIRRGKPLEIESGQLGEPTELAVLAKPPVPVVPAPTVWQKARTFFRDFGGVIGWILATLLALLQIRQMITGSTKAS